MRVIFRFREGFRREEEWKDMEEPPRYFSIPKPVGVEMLTSGDQPDELGSSSWRFYLQRLYLDEYDRKVCIYDAEDYII